MNHNCIHKKTLATRRFLPLEVDQGYLHDLGEHYITYNVKTYFGNNEKYIGDICIYIRTKPCTYKYHTWNHICSRRIAYICFGDIYKQIFDIYIYICIYIYKRTKPYTYMYLMWKNVFTTLEDNRYLLETHKYIYICDMHIYIYILNACIICGGIY